MLPTSPACRHAARILPGSRPPSRSAPASIPIALAAQPVPDFPRLRALALFGRRTAERAEMSRYCRRPKTLYGACRCQEKTRHALSHFVTSLDCIAARLLSCSAALSGQSPEAACGAPKARGLTANARTEQEYRCRDVQMSSGRYFDLLCGFLFCRFSFHRHASSRSLKIRFDMIRGELAIGRGNRATTLYSVDPRGSVP